MTNEEAKKVLQKQIEIYGMEYDDEGIEALEFAIKGLEQLEAYQKAYEEMRKLPIVWEFGEGVKKCITIIENCLEEGR
jgi:hypothetical protein